MPAALAAVIALAVASCGGGGEGDAMPPATDRSELTVVLDRDGDGGEPAQRAELSCPADGPSLCDPVAALPADAGAPVPPDTACTEIYGGPDRASIEGTIEGRPIDAELTRADGCEIERFDVFVPLLQALFGGYEPGEALAP